MNNKSYLPPVRKAGVLLLLGFTVLLVVLPRTLGDQTAYICVAYAVLSTLFLGAQVWGFVVTQMHYSESVEEAKFAVLELEEKMPWENEE